MYNQQLADTFSIGLTVLECMTLISPLPAYNNKHELDLYYFESMFRVAERRGYSPYLIAIVK